MSAIKKAFAQALASQSGDLREPRTAELSGVLLRLLSQIEDDCNDHIAIMVRQGDVRALIVLAQRLTRP